MKDVRQALTGILAVLLSTVVVFGSIVMVMNETGLGETMEPAVGETEMALSLPRETMVAATPSAAALLKADTLLSGQSLIETVTPTWTTTETATSNTGPTALPTATPTPSDASAEDPGGSKPKPTKINCGPPLGWVVYIVRYGDTLYSLGMSFGVSVGYLQMANCMGSSTLIRTGQKLWVPNVPTRTPSPAPAHPGTATLIPSQTTPTGTPSPSAPQGPSPTHTETPVPADTAVPTNTVTPTETAEPTAAPAPIPS